MRILVAGDYCDHGRISKLIESGSYHRIFGELKEITGKADFSVVNFEFPVSCKNAKPIIKNGPCLIGREKAIEALSYSGFNVCTLANNHILDQGHDCCLYTRNKLEENGFRTVGVGKDLNEASQILYLEKNGERIAVINCCEHEFSIATTLSAGSNPLNVVNQYYKIQEARDNADFVLVIVHGGHENFQLPSQRMKETYRFFIKAGADAVINHHQHCYSGFEIIDGKPIFYGLGNLIFDWDGKRNSSWNEGYMVDLDFSDKGISFNLIPYIQGNENPGYESMSDNEKEFFKDNIDRLNAIIADDELLDQEVKTWMMKTSKRHLGIFQPYVDKISSALFSRGWLPSLLTRRKVNLLKNYINCESHLERVRYMINNY